MGKESRESVWRAERLYVCMYVCVRGIELKSDDEYHGKAKRLKKESIARRE